MKYLFVSMLISAGVMVYLSTSMGKNLSGLANLKFDKTNSTEVSTQPADDEDNDKEEFAEQRMVQVQGKWYKYRADNTYMIDGIPTLHIAKKIEAAAKPSRQNSRTTAEAQNPNLEKSQKLAKMATENPTAVYTPEGMKAFKDGLEAAQASAKERKKTLEQLANEP